jgi:hypothetical protein
LEEFEKDTFTAKDVDTAGIEEYLASLFDNRGAQNKLQRIRRDMESYGEDLMEFNGEVEEETLQWCIVDLIKNELISDEKKKTLQGYLQSPMALSELAGLLKMKSIQHWKWRGAEKGLPVTARMNGEGKYCIVVEEDIIDMLFLHTLAVGWSMKLRECLSAAVSHPGVWPGPNPLSPDEFDKRECMWYPTS